MRDGSWEPSDRRRPSPQLWKSCPGELLGRIMRSCRTPKECSRKGLNRLSFMACRSWHCQSQTNALPFITYNSFSSIVVSEVRGSGEGESTSSEVVRNGASSWDGRSWFGRREVHRHAAFCRWDAVLRPCRRGRTALRDRQFKVCQDVLNLLKRHRDVVVFIIRVEHLVKSFLKKKKR